MNHYALNSTRGKKLCSNKSNTGLFAYFTYTGLHPLFTLNLEEGVLNTNDNPNLGSVTSVIGKYSSLRMSFLSLTRHKIYHFFL
jgi:hypothetical protein